MRDVTSTPATVSGAADELARVERKAQRLSGFVRVLEMQLEARQHDAKNQGKRLAKYLARVTDLHPECYETTILVDKIRADLGCGSEEVRSDAMDESDEEDGGNEQ